MKKFFQRIGAFLALLLGNTKKFERFLIDHVDEAIEIVNKLKKVLDSQLLHTILDIIPDKYGDPAEEVIYRIAKTVDRVLDELGLAEECLNKTTTLQRLQCFADHLKNLKGAHRNALYLKFASLYTQYSSGQDLQENVVDAIVQNRVVELKNKITA